MVEPFFVGQTGTLSPWCPCCRRPRPGTYNKFLQTLFPKIPFME